MFDKTYRAVMPRLLFTLVILLSILPAQADEVKVAVAANFTVPSEEIASAFEAETGHDIQLSFGSTGGLYAQISQGAPFDVFLAADGVRARRAIVDGHGAAGSYFTYAVGRLALYAPRGGGSESGLRGGHFAHLAVADPQNAPYGAAAMQTLEYLGLADALAGKVVTGTNVTQTLQFIETGNAEMGFVALSQVIDAAGTDIWLVPDSMHNPIEQGGILLEAGAGSDAARAFVAFLHSPVAEAIIRKHGYTIPTRGLGWGP